ncbi:MAG: hypothetical protein AB1801_13025 [Chloroflexota bacterium]
MAEFLPDFTNILGFFGSNGRSGCDVLEQDLVSKYPNSTPGDADMLRHGIGMPWLPGQSFQVKKFEG